MKKNLPITAYGLLLSVVSWVVVMKGAGDEPYVVFRRSDALVQLGLGVALIILWLQFGAWLIYAASARQIARVWLVLTVWIVIVLLYLWESPFGYIEDITKFVVKKQ